MLTASCATGGDPGALVTTINIRACGSEISNDKGWLSCFAKPNTWGEGHAFPHGGYLESCTRPFVNGKQLQAVCKDRNGGSNRTSVDLSQCSMGNNIVNNGGQLICIR